MKITIVEPARIIGMRCRNAVFVEIIGKAIVVKYALVIGVRPRIVLYA
jgi:hypothetical protein